MRTSAVVAQFPAPSPGPAIVARGRDAAVEQLFDEHATGLFRLARLMLHRIDEAEDVVQETFLKLTAHLGAGRPLPNARAWLFTVAAHACRDRQRTRWRWVPWLPELDHRPSLQTADAIDAASPVLDAIRALRPRDRLLIALRAQGLGYREIATAARIRPASVGRLLTRAIDRLAARMAAPETRR